MKFFFFHVTTFGLRTAPISNRSFNLLEVHSWIQTNSCCPSNINRQLTLRPLAVHNIPCNRGFCWHNDQTRLLLQTPQSLWPRLQRFTLFRLRWVGIARNDTTTPFLHQALVRLSLMRLNINVISKLQPTLHTLDGQLFISLKGGNTLPRSF